MIPELKHLKRIAAALTELGYKVEAPKCGDYLDVWGYETLPGRKRRRKCFEEIYCSVHSFNGLYVSYWTTNKTYDAESESIEIMDLHNGGLSNLGQLVSLLSVDPLKRRGVK